MWRTFIKVLVLLLAFPAYACDLPDTTRAALDWASEISERFASHITRGDIFLGARCLAEARSEYIQAGEALAPLPASEEKVQKTFAAEGSLQLVEALEHQQRGDLDSARALLMKLFELEFSRMRPPVTYALAEIGQQTPLSEKEAATLEKGLRELAKRGHHQADAYLVDRLLAAGRGGEALDQIEGRLQGDLVTLDRLALHITYAKALYALGRVTEAQILLHDIADDVGENVVDPGERRRFLSLGLEVAEASVESHPTGRNREYAGAFREALRRLDRLVLANP